MQDASSNRRGQPFGIWLCGVVILVVAYLASPGPVVWLTNHKWISRGASDRLFETAYAPLVWMEFNTDFFDNPVGAAYADYVDWFDD